MFFLLFLFKFFLNVFFCEVTKKVFMFLILKFLSAKKIIAPESLSNFADFVYFSLTIIFLFKFLTKRVYDYFVKFQ